MPKLICSSHIRGALAAFANLAFLSGCMANAQAAAPATHTYDIAVGYTAERSLRANSDQNFWLQGGSAEAGVALWHGLGPAVNVTGAHASSIGTSSTPLSLITVTTGPRFRANSAGRWSPYGQFLVGFATGLGSSFPRSTGITTEATSFAFVSGGGLDIILQKHLFLRAVDVSYVRTQLPNGTNNSQNTLRIGTGLGWRFH